MSKQQPRRAAVQPSRSSKALANKRNTSHAHVQSRSGSSSRKSGGLDITYQSTEPSEDDVSGLPQFCMTCEKQIVTPGISILYCSTACRRKDASRPLSMHAALPTPSSIPTAASYFDLPEPDIVRPRSPTALRPPSMSGSEYCGSEPSSPIYDQTDFAYGDSEDRLVQFPPFQSHSYAERRRQEGRSRPGRSSSAIDGPPSLTHTPSSSIGTVGSVDPNVLRRYHRSSGFFDSQSVDLVMPSFEELKVSQAEQDVSRASLASGASTRTAFRVADTEDSV